MTVDEIINDVLRLCKAQQAREVYLFGSRAKGTALRTSDIDIAVIVSHRSDDYFSEVPLLWTLKREVSNLIEPVLLTEGEDSPLYQDVMKTGIRI